MRQPRRVLCALATATLAALGSARPVRALDGLQPTWRGTTGLEQALASFTKAAEAPQPPRLATARKLERGDRGPEVERLRARLAADGEPAAAPPADPALFDDSLADAVRRFQSRHGLDPDAVVGPETRAELDQSPSDRVRQIGLTIVARRALPAELGDRFVLVNLSAFTVEAFDPGGRALALRVIVGQPNRRSPKLSAVVRELVVHPYWNVPARIARQELTPHALRDPGYLRRLDIEVFTDDGRRVEPSREEWRAFQKGDIRYVLRQLPGPLNALGEVSFQFPNPDNVCLHDTPDQGLFLRARRALSHGCMRVQHAVELARWVLEAQPESAGAAFTRALAGSTTTHIELSTPIPVYVVDWPVWVDPDGVLQLRPEIYPQPSNPSESCDCSP